MTVGIGGNDAGLVGVAEKCAELGVTHPNGTACRDYWAPGGNDQVAAKIEAAKPKIAGVLQGIHQRSPKARVAIVGYPDVTPKNGESCYPMVPLSADDLRYIDELIIRINAMIAGQAAANDAEFVDTYTDSGGHDVCKLPPERWFEGLVPTEPAYPLHPNAKGEASMARSAIAQLKKPRPGGRPRRVDRRAASPTGRRSAGEESDASGSATRAALAGLAVAPVRRTRAAYSYCTKRGSAPGERRVLEARARGARPQHRPFRRVPALVSKAAARRVRSLPGLATRRAAARRPRRPGALRGGCGPQSSAFSAQTRARPPSRGPLTVPARQAGLCSPRRGIAPAQGFAPNEPVAYPLGLRPRLSETCPVTGASPPDMPAPTSTPRRKRSPASSTPGSASQVF